MSDHLNGQGAAAEEFNLDEFTDSQLVKSTCMVCSLPITTQKGLERSLFHDRTLDFATIANDYNLKDHDITAHVNECILNRNSLIPNGQFLRQFVSEIEIYFSNLQRWKRTFHNEMSSDNAKAYSMMVEQLRRLTREVRQIYTHEEMGYEIVKKIINPMVIVFLRNLNDECYNLVHNSKKMVYDNMKEEHKVLVQQSYINMCEKLSSNIDVSCQTLADFLGVDPDSVKMKKLRRET